MRKLFISKKSKVRSSYLLILLFALLTWSPAQAQLPWLHVDGNTIKDASGNVVTLRGFSLLPNENNNECTTCNTKPISEMLAWQADASRGWYSRVVRIGVHQAFTNPAAAFANHIDPFVQQARALNLYVIVDLHLVSDYSVNGSPGITQAQVLAFWNYVAPRYANVSNVIFEIYNEPINPDNWTSWKNYIQPVVNAVRSAAPNNLILVGNPQWSTRVNEAVTNPITGGNLAYVYHLYPNQGDPNAANLNAKFGNAANSIPILITEFGWNQDPNYSDGITFGTTGGWGQTFRAYMDSRPHIGWVNYIFDNYWKPQIFDWNWNLLSGENQGKYIRDWLFETQKSNQAGGFVHGPQTAYATHNFPGRVQAENFDNGEQDGAYHESTYDNQGGTTYRTTPVDVGTTADGGTGHIVGFINQGEWLEYTIANLTSGTYNINLRTASADPATGKSITVKLNGVTLGTVTPGNTGGWETYQTLTLSNVAITGGTNRILRLEFGGSGYNFNWIEFVSTGGGGNVAPTANAGTDKSVTLPTNSVTLNGSGTDSDGTISTYAWTRVSGPNTPTMTGANTANLTSSGLIAGTYVFRLTVTDNGGLTASDDATVTVSNSSSANLALNKPVTVSSVENSTFPGSNAVDGNAGTRWSSAFSDPQWIYVDLGATYNVNRVKVTWEAAYGRDYLVQVGASTSSWTTIKTITGNTVTTNDHTGLSGTGRYLRIYGTARGTVYGYSIFELEVYGTATSNTPPVVSITSPANGATFTAPANVTINANASDANGTVSKVEFFNGATKLGEDLSSPYSFTWSNVTAGSYVLTAKATDNAGASTTSSAVNITVSVASTTKMLEAELLSYWSSGATSSVTTEAAASGGKWVLLSSDGVGDFIEYTVNQTEGQVTYNVYLRFKSGPDRGTCQMYENNSAMGAVFDQYTSTQTFNEVLVASNVTLYNGDRKFRFQVAGKNASSSNYRLSQDYLKLVKTSTSSAARIATETETSTSSEENSNSIQLYPNPASSTIQLNGLPEDAARIAIFDMLGIEHIAVIPNKQRSIEVNVQKLTRGMYILRVESTSRRWAKLKFFRE